MHLAGNSLFILLEAPGISRTFLGFAGTIVPSSRSYGLLERVWVLEAEVFALRGAANFRSGWHRLFGSPILARFKDLVLMCFLRIFFLFGHHQLAHIGVSAFGHLLDPLTLGAVVLGNLGLEGGPLLLAIFLVLLLSHHFQL